MIENQLTPELKKQLIQLRLQNIARQYYDAELDKVQAEAIGLTNEIPRLEERMTQLQAAYTAIEELLNTIGA